MKWCKASKNRPTGMTLIELLIVVAILVITASLLYPSYQSQLLRVHRTAAISDLARIQIELERQYQSSYALAADSLLTENPCHWCQASNRHFTFAIIATDSSYTIEARPINSQLNDRCNGDSYVSLTVNHRGEHAPANCWQ